jgi:hypothetical protein
MLFYVTMVAFRMTFLMKKWKNVVTGDGWVHPLVKSLPSLVSNVWRNIVMDHWNLDKPLSKWQYLQPLQIYNPPTNLQGMTKKIVGLTLSVGDTIPRGLQLVWSKTIGDTKCMSYVVSISHTPPIYVPWRKIKKEGMRCCIVLYVISRLWFGHN